MTPEPARRCAVLGSPIAHSLSPALHRAAYAHLGLTDWSYGWHEVDAAGLAGFVARCGPSWRGLSLTMPLKTAALALGEVDPLAELAGAGNTLIFDDDRHRVYNTDVGGLVAAVGSAGVTGVERAIILGAGATARSSLVSVSRLGAASAVVVARNPERARPLAELGGRLGLRVHLIGWGEPVPAADLLISTVTAGAADEQAEALAGCAPVIFDAIYDPWPTALAVAAEAAGRAVVNGLDLLVGQAVLQVELMTGRTVPHTVLYEAGQAELRRRTGPGLAR